MNLSKLLIHTENWAQEELGAQGRLLTLLQAQEEAIKAGSTDKLVSAGEAVESELRTGAAREHRRREITRVLGKTFGVRPESLTLASIAERVEEAGEDPQRLRRLRDELREMAARVLKRGRRIATLARYHQGMVRELMHAMVGTAEFDGPRPEGVLLDAEG